MTLAVPCAGYSEIRDEDRTFAACSRAIPHNHNSTCRAVKPAIDKSGPAFEAGHSLAAMIYYLHRSRSSGVPQKTVPHAAFHSEPQKPRFLLMDWLLPTSGLTDAIVDTFLPVVWREGTEEFRMSTLPAHSMHP